MSENQASEIDRIAVFRGKCMAVRNTAVAMLCGDALRGDAEARTRILAIMDGQPDPGSVASRARCAELRKANGLPDSPG